MPSPRDKGSRLTIEWLRAVLDHSPVPTWLNYEGHIVYVNRAGCELLGLESASDLAGRTAFDVIESEYHEQVRRRIKALQEGTFEVTAPLVEKWKRSDGTVVEVEVFAWMVPVDDKHAVQVSFRSMAETRKAELLQREHEAQFRTLADSIPQLCWMANADGWIFWYNRRWYEYTGATPEQMEGWGWQSVHDPNVLLHVMERWKTSIASGEQFEMVFPLRGADGVLRPFLTRITPMKDENGNVRRWFGTNTDITSEKEAERALQESLNRFTVLVNTIPQLVWTCNERGDCDYLSQRWLEYTGATLQEGLGYGWGQFLHPEDRERVFAGWREAVRGKSEFNEEFRIRRHDGAYGWFLARGVPFKGADGEVRWFGSNTDISERKQAEQALIRSEKLALVGRMAATVAHEINNPLEAVTNALFLVKVSDGLPASVKPYLQMADDELRRVAQISRQALGFYREPSTAKEVAVREVLESAVELMSGKFLSRGVRLERQYRDDPRVMAVSGELRQVFANLIVNALDAIPGGGVLKLRISTTSAVDGVRRVRVIIADDGKGISNAVLPHIFEPFFTTKENVGTGLGLWISRQIVEKHQGTIRLRSASEGARHGTAFCVALPAV